MRAIERSDQRNVCFRRAADPRADPPVTSAATEQKLKSLKNPCNTNNAKRPQRRDQRDHRSSSRTRKVPRSREHDAQPAAAAAIQIRRVDEAPARAQAEAVGPPRREHQPPMCRDPVSFAE